MRAVLPIAASDVDYSVGDCVVGDILAMAIALLAGCVNDLLAPDINTAAINVLTRHGVEVVLPAGLGQAPASPRTV